MRALIIVALVTVLSSCGDSPTGSDDAASGDASTGLDGGGLDASGDGGSAVPCAVDEDCSDDVFCDGVERCMPGATDADARGCVEAPAGPCAAGEICDEDAGTCDAVCTDADRDGHGDVACGGDDCDDGDANRYPGNVEVCDMSAHDEDCNTDTFGFLDGDSDGSGSYLCCNTLAGGDLGCGDDCNDGDSTVNPRAGDGPPLYCDGLDNDCSGTADEGCPCVEGDTQECGTEPQRMRIGVCRPGTQVCSGGELTATCIGAIPAGEEICDGLDNDCDLTIDEAVLRSYYPDVDGDGFGASGSTAALACSAPAGYASNATDCDDAIASVSPVATEVCNARDDNCTGGIDEGFVATFYADADGDGFGDATMAVMACSPPSGHVRNATDCDDTNGSRNPATIEGCNGIDDNCNGASDEGLLRAFYLDADGDAWGVASTTMMACSAPAGYADRSGDCDDTRASANPAGTEVCNGLDDNCAGGVDEGVLRTFYLDADRDSFGLATSTMTACTAPAMHSDRAGDCNDASASVNPAAAELCNGRDDNCDGATDTGCTCTDGTTRSCGPASETGECRFGQQTCVGGGWGGCVGAVLAAAETCNGLDDDCDGTADETLLVACYQDRDTDTYGYGASAQLCPGMGGYGGCPSGYSSRATDCNDGNASVYPGATEICNGIDDNCADGADETLRVSCYADGDGDGYGTGAASQQCRDSARASFGNCPVGYTTSIIDCNDSSASVRPGATEVCNGQDDDCNGTPDSGLFCALGASRACTGAYGTCASVSGTCTCNGTCTAETFTPSVPSETCNGLDDNCNGTADDGFACVRSSAGNACTTACGTPGTYTCSTSCTAGICAASTESCNGCDDDRDGAADDGFACVRGSSQACTTACGTPGTRYCLSDCSGWDACRASTETCNSCDDDVDGLADDGFACTRDQLYTCTSACGNPGQRFCNSTCTGHGACTEPDEVCDYCDGDGDGSYMDDVDEATGCQIRYSSVCSCSSLLTAGSASCTVLLNGTNQIGAVWDPTGIPVGFGDIEIDVNVEVQRLGTWSGFPGDGWTFLLTNAPTTTTNRVGPWAQNLNLGYPTGHGDGISIQWTWNDASATAGWVCEDSPINLTTGNADDWLYIQSFSNTYPPTCSEVGQKVNMTSFLGARGVLPCAYGDTAPLDYSTTGNCAGTPGRYLYQRLRVILTPDNPDTPPNETRVRVMLPNGTVIRDLDTWSMLRPWQPGDMLYVGMTAASRNGVMVNWRHNGAGGCSDGAGRLATVRDACPISPGGGPCL